MPSHPLSLTVIIPTLNEAVGIEQSIANVRDRLPEAQLIIVDGGSEDNTIELARNLGVRHILSSKRVGARNWIPERNSSQPT